jgi:probable rRNA maturation factor
MNIETTVCDPAYGSGAEDDGVYQPSAEFAQFISEIESVAEFACAQMGIHADSDLDITIVTPHEMERLHIEWMDLPGPTDVLSFPMDELTPHSLNPMPGVVGDIVLCPTFIIPQAKENGKTVLEELCLLTVHGVLHCLGYDHRDANEEKEMFGLQNQILEKWNGQR